MFHVKRRLVQENKTRIVFPRWYSGSEIILRINCLARSWGEAAPPARVRDNYGEIVWCAEYDLSARERPASWIRTRPRV
jgi:hypothetical protein